LDNDARRYNDYGQLGLGSTNVVGSAPGQMGSALPFVDMGTAQTATQITAGFGHTCALLSSGKIKCWGSNDYGELGQGNTNYAGDGVGPMGNALPFVNLGTGLLASAVSAGASRACALLSSGSVKCWGCVFFGCWFVLARTDDARESDNADGELGLGNVVEYGSAAGQMGNALPVVNLGTSQLATRIVTGNKHTCVEVNDGVKCWGCVCSSRRRRRRCWRRRRR